MQVRATKLTRPMDTGKRAHVDEEGITPTTKRRRTDSFASAPTSPRPHPSSAPKQSDGAESDGLEEGELEGPATKGPPETGRTITDQTLNDTHTIRGAPPVTGPHPLPAIPQIPASAHLLPGNLVAPPILPVVVDAELSPGMPEGPDNFPEVRSAKYKRIFEDERAGRVTFRLAHNDGTKEHLSLLSRLKTVIQAQLPKMPREYIARVVYSREHYSYVVVRDSGEVVGGITFRPFAARKFAEIVFLAVLSMSQTAVPKFLMWLATSSDAYMLRLIKGYGARLIAHFKDYVKEAFGTQHLLTYADNLAIGFFKKQGFTPEISLDKSIWVGYIKDYEGATLLQCTFLRKVKYKEMYTIYAAHRKAVFQRIKEASLSYIVYDGLSAFKAGVDRVDPLKIPGLENSGWFPEMEDKPKGSAEGTGPMHGMLFQLLHELRENASAWPFREPVSGVADYYNIIRNPMDLATMEGLLKDGTYQTYEQFEADFNLIIQNAKMYNDETTPYYKAACRLDRYCKDRAKQLIIDFGIIQI
ncbi:histone acetyltransferase [Thoreauomyces humboldtii]|nr:histone acetyltransferase [Thoreauomyces humboldtii]